MPIDSMTYGPGAVRNRHNDAYLGSEKDDTPTSFLKEEALSVSAQPQNISEFSEEELGVIREYNRRNTARQSFKAFKSWMSTSGHPDFDKDWPYHLEVIAAMLQRVADGEIKKCIISISPGAAKTTLIVQWRAWLACREPDHQFIAVSATQNLAESISRRVRSAIQTDEWRLLSGTEIHQDQQSVQNFGYGTSGSQTSFGIGAKLIGRRANAIAIDDYVGSYEDVATEAQREKVWDWFKGPLLSRLIPGSPIAVIGTRWSPDDLISKITSAPDTDEWTHIRIPMEADSEDDALGRSLGQRLWPEYFNQRDIDLHKLDVKNWHCMWQCKPLLETVQWLPVETLEIINERPNYLTNFFAGVDIALTEGAGDYTVILVGALSPERKLVLVDMVRKRISPDKIIEELVKIHDIYNVQEFLLDDDNASKTLMSLANEMLRRRGKFLPLVKMPMHGLSKELRAAPFKGLALQGGVQLVRSGWNEAFLKEISEFPRQATGIHDDCVDAAAVMAKRMSVHSAGEVPKENQTPKPILGCITQDEFGNLYTTQTLDDLFNEKSLSASRREII